MNLRKNRLILTSAALGILLSSCCTKNTDGSETCSFTLGACSNKVTGYAIFANGIHPNAGRTIQIQWSDDSFATHTNLGQSVRNSQGFIAVPFSFDATYTCGTIPSIQLRAFEATPNSSTWALGNPTGRSDGTTTGNDPLISVSASSAVNQLIYIDGMGVQ